jgi:hypothetical protein
MGKLRCLSFSRRLPPEAIEIGSMERRNFQIWSHTPPSRGPTFTDGCLFALSDADSPREWKIGLVFFRFRAILSLSHRDLTLQTERPTDGTIVVDLERREVVDLLPYRSAAGTAGWLSLHPEDEIISRDRGGGLPHFPCCLA